MNAAEKIRVPIYEKWPQWAKILLSFGVMVGLCLIVYFFNIPNPNMIVITGLVVCTSLFGYPSGVVCSVVMILYSMFFFSTDHSFIHFTDINRQKLLVIILGTLMNLLFVGQLKSRHSAVLDEMEELNRMLQEDNKALQHASMVDALTGLRNRFSLRRDYGSYDGGGRVYVMMLDVDDFKSINDRLGHDAGDAILCAVGDALQKEFGETGCYRYGGDEFLVIARDTDESAFNLRLEAVRRKLDDMTLNGRRNPVHLSAGYVFGALEESRDLRLMIRHADHHLYQAKSHGKDCVAGGKYRRAQAEQLGELKPREDDRE